MKKLLFFTLILGFLSIIAKPEATTRTTTDGKFTIVESEDGSIAIIDTQTGKVSTVPKMTGTKTFTWEELLGRKSDESKKTEKKPSILEQLFGTGKQTTQEQKPAEEEKPSIWTELFGKGKQTEEQKQPEEKPSIWSDLFGTKKEPAEKTEKEGDYPKTLGGWLERLTKKK